MQSLLIKGTPVLLALLAGLLCYCFFFTANKNENSTDAIISTQQKISNNEEVSLNRVSPEKLVLIKEYNNTSLEDTAVDRATINVIDGQIVLNGGLLFYFDYFLNLQGEKKLSVIKANKSIRPVKAS